MKAWLVYIFIVHLARLFFFFTPRVESFLNKNMQLSSFIKSRIIPALLWFIVVGKLFATAVCCRTHCQKLADGLIVYVKITEADKEQYNRLKIVDNNPIRPGSIPGHKFVDGENL